MDRPHVEPPARVQPGEAVKAAKQKVRVFRRGSHAWMPLAEYLRTMDYARLDPVNVTDGRATQFRLYEVEAVDPNPFNAEIGDALIAGQCVVAARQEAGMVLFVPGGGLVVKTVVDTKPLQKVRA